VTGGTAAAKKENATMQYLATLYDHEGPQSVPGTPEWDATFPGYMRFGELAASAIRGGEALAPTTTAITVRPDESGGTLVTDGPFAETAEVFGGYYLLEADSLDDVIELAKEIPNASQPNGGVELRPVVMVWEPETPVTKGDGDTRYLAAILGPETKADIPDTPEWDESAAAHGQFIEKHAGTLMNGLALHPASTATTVRVRNGETLVTDGPFTETNEITGGAYVLRAASREEAIAVAQDVPLGPGGAVELRPIVEFT
jgi:hypothetical protein